MSATPQTRTDDTSVYTSIHVKASIERCWKVFTEGFNSWWPRGHHIGKADMQTAIIEPRAGGRWYEVGVDGSECDWGRVLAYEPPRRLLLSWHLNGAFQFDPDPAHASELEIRFVEDGARATRVELAHRHLDRHGGNWQELVRGVSTGEGWPGLLGMFADHAELPGQ